MYRGHDLLQLDLVMRAPTAAGHEDTFLFGFEETPHALSTQATGPITGTPSMMRHRQNQYFFRFN
jgi:hypothetical protein